MSTDGLGPNAPGYQPLRVAAEWASAVRGEPFPMRYDSRTGRIVVDRERPEVTTTTLAYARRPLVREVTIEITTPEGTTVTRNLQGDAASALFWEESAVEKFLLSYYASASAGAARGFMTRLLGAWNGYPARVVQVCALVHLCGTRTPPDGTQLSLEATVGFLCLEGEELCVRTLAEFEARYDLLPTSRGGTPVPYPEGPQPGWAVTPGVENIVVREAAEFVSGLRGWPIAFDQHGDTLYPVVLPPVTGDSPPHSYVFGAMAEMIRPDRPLPSRITLWVDEPDGTVCPVPIFPGEGTQPGPDSVFWSDGSVERFLLPYYASVKGKDGWFFDGWLMGKWAGLIAPDATAPAEIQHFVDTFIARHGVNAGEGVAEDPYSPVYAITHLPRSEYESSTLEDRTVLLWRGDELHTRDPLLRGGLYKPAAPRGR